MNNQLTSSDQQQIAQLVRDNRMIEAIKLYREKTGAGLKEAKEAVELLQAGQSPPPVSASAHAADRSAVIHQYQVKGKIAAIKLYRDQTPGCGLKEAKEAVEEIARQNGLRERSGGCFSVMMLWGLLALIGAAGVLGLAR